MRSLLASNSRRDVSVTSVVVDLDFGCPLRLFENLVVISEL